MWVKIRFFKGPQPQEVEFNNVTSIHTVEVLGYTRLVLSIDNNVTHTPEAYSTPTYLINVLEVRENDDI